ncbi:MAG: hypothetical protein CMI18_02225 [Opitutaceae bacterium]|nr:hypothetical protein [Opitutaceae bacterium]|tara:strand:- start:5823 stop:6266 length:444 start_codon:yes stop_codon:yes gene_type:complete
MELLTSVICDSASDYNGKLCILGAFDTIWSAKFPSQHPHCTLALRFLFTGTDLGKHEFKVVFVDADGKELLPKGPLKFAIQIGRVPDEKYFLSRNLVVNMQGLPLPEPGQYAFDVHCNDEVISRIPLQAIQGNKPPPRTKTAEGNQN